MRIGIYTLGCKVNQAESAAMAAMLSERGHEMVDFQELAEVYIINTCAVTGESARKARQVIRQAKKRGGRVAVCGCYSQVDAPAVRELGADLVGGTGDRRGFIERIEQMDPIELDNPFQRRQFELLPTVGDAAKTRAFLKVQDGCTCFCSYCIIPYARGAVRSMPESRVVEAVRGFAEQGYREIVLTGIEISEWGRDLPGRPPVEQMIAAVCRTVPQLRIRLSSLDPRVATEGFCQTLRQYENLCAHFHLSLQSGCDKTLAAMGRKYRTQDYLAALARLRRFFENPAITTDLIAGFPGETEEDFAETLRFIRSCNFAAMHVFPFSKRQGTPAASMPQQMTQQVKAQRAAQARAAAAEMTQAYLAPYVGTRMQVLFEQEKDGYSEGYTSNYIHVKVSAKLPRNSLLPVQIERIEDGALWGSV